MICTGYSSDPASPPFQAKTSLSAESGSFSSALSSFADIAQSRRGSYVSGSSISSGFDQVHQKRNAYQLDPLQRLQQQKQEVAKEMLELERRKQQLEKSERLYKQQQQQIISKMSLNDDDSVEPASPAERPLDFDYFDEVRDAMQHQRKGMSAWEAIPGPKTYQQRIAADQLKSRMSQQSVVSSYAGSLYGQRTRPTSAYEEALESLEIEAKGRRTLACVKNATFTWRGYLTPKHYDSPTYASKVFVGGLPYDVTAEMLAMIFGRFGASVQLPPRGRGHAYLVFESEVQVHALLRNCEREDDGKFFMWVPSRRGKERKAQVIPWAIEDSDWLSPDCPPPSSLGTTSEHSSSGSRSQSVSSDASSNASTTSLIEDAPNAESPLFPDVLALQRSPQSDPSGFSKQNTVFVGALHGEITAEYLQKILSELFGPIVHVGIDTDKNR